MSGRTYKLSVAHWGALLLFVVAFGPSLGSGFVYDDQLLIVDNAFAHSFAYVARAFSTHFWDVLGPHEDAQRYYRPLVTVSYIVDWQVGAGAPWSFHLTNVVLHAAAVLLAASWARRLLGSALWVLPVALFALHPSRAESVYWVSGRSDVMVSLFLLLAVEASHRLRERRPFWWVVFAASMLCALLTKELAVVLPFLLLVDNAHHGTRSSRSALLVAVAVSLGYVLLRMHLLPVGALEAQLTPKLGLLTVEGFVERLFWPWPQTMFFRTRLSEGGAGIELFAGAAIVVATVALVVVAWRRDRPAFWLLVSALAGLFPVSNVFAGGLPVLASDRFLYLPWFLAALGATRLFSNTLERWLTITWLRLLSVGVLLVMTAILLLRLPPFEDSDSFWAHELGLDACNALGLEYQSHRAARLGNVPSAVEHLERMLTKPCVVQTKNVYPPLFERARVRRLALKAAITPDGDVVGLEQLLGQLARERSAHDSERLNLDAELVGLATRLGRDDLALKHLRAVEAADLDGLAAPANLVLAVARLGLHERAVVLLTRLRTHEPAALIDERTAADLGQRLERVAQLSKKARENRESSAQLSTLAQAELGAYLRALRILTPVYDASSDRETVALFVQLLVLARLEDQALGVLSESNSAERARATLNRLRLTLPRQVMSLERVPQERGPSFLDERGRGAQ